MAKHIHIHLNDRRQRDVLNHLSLSDILGALRNAGYNFDKDISAARYTGESSSSGSIYEITYKGESGHAEKGKVYVTERGGRAYAEF